MTCHRQIKSLYTGMFSMLLTIHSLLSGTEKRIYQTQRITEKAPAIDGRLDEPCWQEGIWIGDFLQQQPVEAAPASQKTEFKILYDDTYLYVAIRAYDNEPEKIERQLTRRDAFAGDAVGVAFDSHFDHRTAYEFNLTAAGSKIDLMHLNDFQWDFDWDATWDGKTALEDSAWTVEMRIPFNQLRYAEKEEHIWGLHVWRWLYRYREEDQFNLISLNATAMVPLFGELHGIKNIKKTRHIELLPYALLRYQESANPYEKISPLDFNLGFDGKIGLSSNFTLDVSVNPDFGQVEADPAVVNLTAFETFFPEKRPFFMEGRNIMTYTLDEDLLYYSRRIGHQPSYRPTGEGFIQMPDNATILSALKLSGRTANGLSLGILQSITTEERATIYTENKVHQEQTVEPLASYLVGRIQKEYNSGNTVAGAMLTATNRQISEDHLKFLPKAAYAGGIDFLHYWQDKTYYTKLKAIMSQIQGDPRALIDIQSSSRHYFQRPDINYIQLDSTRELMRGYGGLLEYGKSGNGRWRFSQGLEWRSPELEFNDLGYMQMADEIDQYTSIGYEVNEPTRFFRDYQFSAFQTFKWDYGWRNTLMQTFGTFNANFTNIWSFHTHLNYSHQIRDTRMLRGGPAVRFKHLWEHHVMLESDPRKILMGSLNFIYSWSAEKLKRAYEIRPGLTARVNQAFTISGSMAYAKNTDDMQYVATVPALQKNNWVLAHINQETIDITLRLNYILTPELSIQYYGQPFYSRGLFSHFKEVTTPDAEQVADRCHQFTEAEWRYDSQSNRYNFKNDPDYSIDNPDFRVLSYRSNLVLRWEYKTGSALYCVWSQNRWDNQYLLPDLLNTQPDNIFLIKASYLLFY
jgi:hypothetical protein